MASAVGAAAPEVQAANGSGACGPAVPPHVFAVDLGTSAVKVALMPTDGSIAAWASRPIELRIRPGGGAEQCPDDWWAALGDAAAELAGRYPRLMAAVHAVCCSTQGEGTIPVAADGTVLHDALLWMDMRGAANLRRQHGGPLDGRIGIRGLSAARLARWVRYTGGAPSVTGKDPASHMLWFRDERPEVYARTAAFLNVLDFVNLRLTGRIVATWDSIVTSWVTDNRDPGAIRYQPDLVADCGVAADMLPPLVPSTEILGPLTPAAAEHLRLSREVRVVAGAVDTSAAAVGAGTTGLGQPHLYLGTSSWIAAHVTRKKTDVRRGIAAVPGAIPGRYLMTALQSVAGGSLTWLRDHVLADGGPGEPGEPDRLDRLADLAAQAPPGANGVFYLPWVFGERAPVDDRDLRAGLIGLSLATTRADVVRACYEGVALNTRWLAGAVERFLGSPIANLAVVGGGATSDLWCRIMADVLGVTVRRPADPLATNARGAAWIAAVGLGELTWDDLPALGRIEATYQPDPGNRARYDAAYQDYRSLHRALAPVYRRRADRARRTDPRGLG